MWSFKVETKEEILKPKEFLKLTFFNDVPQGRNKTKIQSSKVEIKVEKNFPGRGGCHRNSSIDMVGYIGEKNRL